MNCSSKSQSSKTYASEGDECLYKKERRTAKGGEGTEERRAEEQKETRAKRERRE